MPMDQPLSSQHRHRSPRRTVFASVCRWLVCASFPPLLWLVAGLFSSVQAQVVIMHYESTQWSLSRDSLRAIFSMRLQNLEPRTPLTVFVLHSDHPVHDEFSKNILGVFPYQLQRSWERGVFSGTGRAPIVVRSEEEMLQRVAQTPGAIGYVSNLTEYAGIRAVELLP